MNNLNNNQNNVSMRKLSLDEMAEINGGKWFECLSGFAALAALAGTAILAPEVFAASMLTGEGTLLAASITSEALYLISIGC